MQQTHETNGDGLMNFPTILNVSPVNVYMHDSNMVAVHDYSCPCCRDNHAVLDLSTGLMQPCRKCEGKYRLVKIDHRNWWRKLLGAVELQRPPRAGY